MNEKSLPEPEELGPMLERARKRVGMSQQDLWFEYATRMKDKRKSPNAVYRWLRGEVVIRWQHYNVLAEVLNEHLPPDEQLRLVRYE